MRHKKTSAPKRGLVSSRQHRSSKAKSFNICPRVITVKNTDGTVALIDPIKEKMFLVDGLAAHLWLMIEQGKSSADLDVWLAKQRTDQKSKKKKELFLSDLYRLELLVES